MVDPSTGRFRSCFLAHDEIELLENEGKKEGDAGDDDNLQRRRATIPYMENERSKIYLHHHGGGRKEEDANVKGDEEKPKGIVNILRYRHPQSTTHHGPRATCSYYTDNKEGNVAATTCLVLDKGVEVEMVAGIEDTPVAAPQVFAVKQEDATASGRKIGWEGRAANERHSYTIAPRPDGFQSQGYFVYATNMVSIMCTTDANQQGASYRSLPGTTCYPTPSP